MSSAPSVLVRFCVLLALSVFCAAPVARGADALADAKRKAVADLLKDGKTADALTLLKEVMLADPNNYKDYLALARIHDKMNRTQEAVEAYRQVVDLPGSADDKAARQEAERRLKVLDAQNGKVAAVEDELLKKLDALEREAMAGKDMRSLEHVFAMRGAVWNARGRRDGFGMELSATWEWTPSGATVKKGVKYRVRAAGYWTIDGTARCTADGLPGRPAVGGGTYGCLLATVDGKQEHLGSDRTFVASATGPLLFTNNLPSRDERARSGGRIFILVQPISGE